MVRVDDGTYSAIQDAANSSASLVTPDNPLGIYSPLPAYTPPQQPPDFNPQQSPVPYAPDSYSPPPDYSAPAPMPSVAPSPSYSPLQAPTTLAPDYSYLDQQFAQQAVPPPPPDYTYLDQQFAQAAAPPPAPAPVYGPAPEPAPYEPPADLNFGVNNGTISFDRQVPYTPGGPNAADTSSDFFPQSPAPGPTGISNMFGDFLQPLGTAMDYASYPLQVVGGDIVDPNLITDPQAAREAFQQNIAQQVASSRNIPYIGPAIGAANEAVASALTNPLTYAPGAAIPSLAAYVGGNEAMLGAKTAGVTDPNYLNLIGLSTGALAGGLAGGFAEPRPEETATIGEPATASAPNAIGPQSSATPAGSPQPPIAEWSLSQGAARDGGTIFVSTSPDGRFTITQNPDPTATNPIRLTTPDGVTLAVPSVTDGVARASAYVGPELTFEGGAVPDAGARFGAGIPTGPGGTAAELDANAIARTKATIYGGKLSTPEEVTSTGESALLQPTDLGDEHSVKDVLQDDARLRQQATSQVSNLVNEAQPALDALGPTVKDGLGNTYFRDIAPAPEEVRLGTDLGTNNRGQMNGLGTMGALATRVLERPAEYDLTPEQAAAVAKIGDITAQATAERDLRGVDRNAIAFDEGQQYIHRQATSPTEAAQAEALVNAGSQRSSPELQPRRAGGGGLGGGQDKSRIFNDPAEAVSKGAVYAPPEQALYQGLTNSLKLATDAITADRLKLFGETEADRMDPAIKAEFNTAGNLVGRLAGRLDTALNRAGKADALATEVDKVLGRQMTGVAESPGRPIVDVRNGGTSIGHLPDMGQATENLNRIISRAQKEIIALRQRGGRWGAEANALQNMLDDARGRLADVTPAYERAKRLAQQQLSPGYAPVGREAGFALQGHSFPEHIANQITAHYGGPNPNPFLEGLRQADTFVGKYFNQPVQALHTLVDLASSFRLAPTAALNDIRGYGRAVAVGFKEAAATIPGIRALVDPHAQVSLDEGINLRAAQQRGGAWSTSDMAKAGLDMHGTVGDINPGVLKSLPVVKQSQAFFQNFGLALRKIIAEKQFEDASHAGYDMTNLAEQRHAANIANLATGSTGTRIPGGQAFVAFPKWTTASIQFLIKAAADGSMEGAYAREALIRTAGFWALASMGVNRAQGYKTDFSSGLPTMRIGNQTLSLPGAYGSLVKGIVLAATGQDETYLLRNHASPFVQLGIDLYKGQSQAGTPFSSPQYWTQFVAPFNAPLAGAGVAGAFRALGKPGAASTVNSYLNPYGDSALSAGLNLVGLKSRDQTLTDQLNDLANNAGYSSFWGDPNLTKDKRDALLATNPDLQRQVQQGDAQRLAAAQGTITGSSAGKTVGFDALTQAKAVRDQAQAQAADAFTAATNAAGGNSAAQAKAGQDFRAAISAAAQTYRITAEKAGQWLIGNTPATTEQGKALSAYFGAADGYRDSNGKITNYDAAAQAQADVYAGLSDVGKAAVDAFLQKGNPNQPQAVTDYYAALNKLQADGYFNTSSGVAQWRTDHPADDALIRQYGFGESTTKYLDTRNQLSSQQAAEDAQLKAGTISPAVWRADLGDRKQQLVGAASGAYGTGALTSTETGAIADYHKAISDATDQGTGKVNWDQVDAWMAAQPKATQDAINSRTTFALSPMAAQYATDMRKVSADGYYNVTDALFERWKANTGNTGYTGTEQQFFTDVAQAFQKQAVDLLNQRSPGWQQKNPDAARIVGGNLFSQYMAPYTAAADKLKQAWRLQHPDDERILQQWGIAGTGMQEVLAGLR